MSIRVGTLITIASRAPLRSLQHLSASLQHITARVASEAFALEPMRRDGRIELDPAAAEAGGVTLGDARGYPVTLDRPGSQQLTGDLVVSAGARPSPGGAR